MHDFVRRPLRQSLLGPLWFLLLTLTILTTGLAGCSQQNDGPAPTVWPMQKDCDLRQDVCTAKAPERVTLAQVPGQIPEPTQSVTLSLSPRPVKVARSLNANVRLSGFSHETIQTLELDVAGLNMYMGYNRVTLQQQSEKRYAGPLMLAFCTNDEMRWQVTVLITLTDGREIQIPFQLTTYNQQSD
ncbi:hypothetical protein [Hydrogenovibrio halophilus]|uniref:hypothetical protein n=1 Tax=Hydrogenovibrio halophilus TaxID=373391 RepID=UPI0012FE4D15|nr:hypothetical protein [Hydrogenovibrio halophilus]